MISLKEKENVYGKLKKLTTVIGTITACMEMENSHGLMGRNILVRRRYIFKNNPLNQNIVNIIQCFDR